MAPGSDYVPIACAFHERLEYAVLRRQWLEIRYREGDQVMRRRALPVDVQTRDGAEWLFCQDVDGGRWVVRLDRLVEAKPA